MKRKLLFPLFGKKGFPAGLKMFLFLLAVFLWNGNTFSQNWDQIIKTVAADRTSGVNLGTSVAISGDYAIVGAPKDGSGAAYIFQKNGASWIQMQKIVASDADSDDHFGYSVAISGDYAVVGAVFDNGDATNANALSDAGSAYIFKRTGATWTQEQKIVALDRQGLDYFGFSVAISGDYVVVGALLQDFNASGAVFSSSTGAAYIYKRTGTSWAQEQKIVASDRFTDDNFGYSVAISGDYVVVGATGEDQDAAGGNTLSNSGSAYVFFRTGTTWAQQQKIVASDRAANDNFAYSVSISGDYLIIGAPSEDENATGGNTATDAGSAYIFTRTGTTWAQQQKIVASDRAANDNFAYSVSISGNYAIIGALYEDENVSGTATLSNSGSAYVIGRSGTTWTQIDKIVASDRAADDSFGRSVGISGDYAIVGSPYEDEDATGANTLADAGSVYIFENCGTVTGTTSVTNVSCFGGSNGTINLTPSGGTPGYTFSWGGGATTEDRTGLTAGSHTVTITDVNGCFGIVPGIIVTQPTTVSLTAQSHTNIACNGGNTGAATVNAAGGGTSPYTYDWTPGTPTGDGTTTVTGLTAGTWTCTVSDNNGCTASVNFNVTQVPAIVVTPNTQTNVSCFGGSNGAASINTPTGGLGGYSYNWTPGNPTGDGSTSVTGLTAQTYTCTVTDGLGCSKTQTFNLTAPPILNGSTVVTNVSCNGGTNGAINLTASGGAGGYTFNWGGGITTEDRTGLVAGTYAVIITDANGCTRNVTGITVTQPTAISGSTVVTNVSCNGGTNGSIDLTPTGGVPGYTYSWGGGTTSQDRINLAAGTYSVTITDANGCVGTVSATVTQSTAISVTPSSQTNVSCFGGSNGAAAVNAATGGAGGYTYNWTPGNPTGDGTTSVNGLTAGTWTCTVTDANSCVASQAFTVTQPSAISVTAASQTNIACNGTATGAAAVNAATGGAGGYTYDWTPGTPTGDGTTSVTGLTAGTYTVTVTDANGCTASQAFTVTQPTAISLTAAAQTNVACFADATGAFEINPAIGGTGSFTYDWTPGTPTGDGTTSVTGLTAGAYSVVATDGNGCTATVSFTITEPTALSVTPAIQTNVSCNGGSNGTAAIDTPTGGTPGYTYNWTPGNPTGDGTVSVTDLDAGTYTVTVTDANGCTADQTFTITEPSAISVSADSQTNVSCNGGSDGTASINTPTGGTPDYTYDWAPGTPAGDGTLSVTGLLLGTYIVTVTDANGCSADQIFTITQPAAITSSFTATDCDSYTWNTQTYNTSGTYTQVLTSASGCDSTVTLNLTINFSSSETLNVTECESYTLNGQTYTNSGIFTQLLTNSAGCDSIITLNLTINTADADTTVATACDSLIWNGQTFTASGFYTLSFTNVNGCDSILNLDLTIVSTPAAGITSLDAVTLQATGAGTYQWIDCSGSEITGETNASFTAASNGSYAVIVSNGACSDTSDCVVINQVGLNENKSSFGVSLIPNPAQNDVTVTFTGANEAFIVIYDAQGKVVMTINQAQSGEVLSVEAFERGVYLVNIVTASGNHTERLVKQ